MDSNDSEKGSEIIYTFPGTLLKKTKPSTDTNFSILSLEELEEIGDKNKDLKPINIHETNESIEEKIKQLSAALKQTSRIGTYNQYLNTLYSDQENMLNEVERILDNSLGKGHNAAADLITLRTSFIAPRIFTLWLTTFERGISLLQKSTRRIEHNGYFIPRVFSENKKIEEEYSLIIQKINEDYNKLLEGYDEEQRKKLREDAMYIQPLSLLSTLTADISLRAFWQMFLESGIESNSKAEKIVKNEDSLSSILEYTSRIFDNLKEKSDFLVKKWNTNYDQLQYYPSGGFLSSKDEITDDIEEILNQKFFNPFSDLNYRFESPSNTLVLDFSDPLKVIERFGIDKIIKVLKSKNDNEIKKMFDILKTVNLKVIRAMDLSLLHQETRHRTIPKEYEPLVYAAERALEHIKFVESIGNKYHEYVKSNEEYFENNSYFNYPKAFKDKKRIEIVAKDYAMLLNFWEKLVKEYNLKPEIANIVLPHGLKLLVVENIDFYNLVKLSSERLCATAKREMQSLTENLRNMIEVQVGKDISLLLQPKCYYLRKCPDQIQNCQKKLF